MFKDFFLFDRFFCSFYERLRSDRRRQGFQEWPVRADNHLPSTDGVWIDPDCGDFRAIHFARFSRRHLSAVVYETYLEVGVSRGALGGILCDHGVGVLRARLGRDGGSLHAMGGQDASSAHSFLVVLAAVLVSDGHTDFFSGKSVFLRGGTYATNRGGLSARGGAVRTVFDRSRERDSNEQAGTILAFGVRFVGAHHVSERDAILDGGGTKHATGEVVGRISVQPAGVDRRRVSGAPGGIRTISDVSGSAGIKTLEQTRQGGARRGSGGIWEAAAKVWCGIAARDAGVWQRDDLEAVDIHDAIALFQHRARSPVLGDRADHDRVCPYQRAFCRTQQRGRGLAGHVFNGIGGLRAVGAFPGDHRGLIRRRTDLAGTGPALRADSRLIAFARLGRFREQGPCADPGGGGAGISGSGLRAALPGHGGLLPV